MAKKKEDIKPIIVIAGKDAALVKRRASEIVDKLLPTDQRATALLSLAGKDASIAQVLDELRTLPFLADRRVVAIQEADSFVTANRAALETYFDEPVNTGTLVLAVNSWNGTTKLAKKLTKVGELINVDPPKPWLMPQELVGMAKARYKKKLAKQASELLVQLTGDDWSRLQSELEKLVLFVGDTKDVTAAHVEQLIGHNRVFGAFEVIDAMSSGNAGQALQRLRNMFSEDKNAQFTAVGAFAFHFRRLFTGKALMTKGRNQAEIAKELRLWGKKDQFFKQLRNLSLEQISRYLQRLAEIDYEIKTGRTRADVAIEQLVLSAAVASASR